MMLAKVVAILACSYVLGKVTSYLIKNVNLIARKLRLGSFEATAAMVGMATTLPDFMVAVSSASRGVSGLAFGNAVGSNIVNLSLIIGVSALVSGRLSFHTTEKIKDSLMPLFFTLLPFLMLIDKQISRGEGAILILIFILYTRNLVKRKNPERRTFDLGIMFITKKDLRNIALKSLAGVGIILLTANTIVSLAIAMATNLNISPIVIGLVIIALGTQLPELVFNIKAAKEKKLMMNMGSIVGSCVNNSTLIIGTAAFIKPIVLDSYFLVMNPAIQYFFVAALMLLFIFSKKRLDAWEGAVLILLYVYYSGLSLYFN